MPYAFLGMLLSGVLLAVGVLASKLSASGMHPVVWLGVAMLGYTASYGLFYMILRSQPVAVTSPVIQATSILTTAVVAACFMGEAITPTKMVAYVLMICGLILLAKS